MKGDFEYLQDEFSQSNIYIEGRRKRMYTFEMDYRETLPHQVTEIRKDMNEAMGYRATLYEEIDLRLFTHG